MYSPLTFIFHVGFVMMLAGSVVQAVDGGTSNCGAWAFWTACQAHGGDSMPQPNFDFKCGVDEGNMFGSVWEAFGGPPDASSSLCGNQVCELVTIGNPKKTFIVCGSGDSGSHWFAIKDGKYSCGQTNKSGTFSSTDEFCAAYKSFHVIQIPGDATVSPSNCSGDWLKVHFGKYIDPSKPLKCAPRTAFKPKFKNCRPRPVVGLDPIDIIPIPGYTDAGAFIFFGPTCISETAKSIDPGDTLTSHPIGDATAIYCLNNAMGWATGGLQELPGSGPAPGTVIHGTCDYHYNACGKLEPPKDLGDACAWATDTGDGLVENCYAAANFWYWLGNSGKSLDDLQLSGETFKTYGDGEKRNVKYDCHPRRLPPTFKLGDFSNCREPRASGGILVLAVGMAEVNPTEEDIKALDECRDEAVSPPKPAEAPPCDTSHGTNYGLSIKYYSSSGQTLEQFCSSPQTSASGQQVNLKPGDVFTGYLGSTAPTPVTCMCRRE